MLQLKTIGRVETISILDLELFDLDAKIDTGAYSNSLHCDDIFVQALRHEDNFEHFQKLFKKKIGKTPSAYRKENSEKV
jgi:hypothetical protein